MTTKLYPTVLITGCSSGIGEGLAIELNKQGYKVLATARNPSKLTSLNTLGIATYPLDVTNQDSINQLATQFEREEIKVDAIINNAGYASIGPMAELPIEDLEQQLSTNVVGIVRVTQAFSKTMLEQQQGLIINIGSVSGILTTPFSGAYCASKAAVHSITDAMRIELAPFNIKVVDVRPGAIQSNFGDNAMSGTEKNRARFTRYTDIFEKIMERANASQENPTSTEEFCKTLIKQCFTENPVSVQYIGNGSIAFPLLKRCLPTPLLDKILSKRFGLNLLKAK
ncbi:SDR family NAD(P)-dependent oxidoreductase [Litoribrevibacter albus]|uniref:Short-chain dehydrogenase/reductase n=1 Tax=Litoribrevibacter albus TaxID=1473156 RepID=A0AA37SAF6_9GAMM|nr:SDR family NAD(P)-dependent oxidoreductase [Litoribrevibacter albus]GLQ32070.1 short-chain dehydrogenase/reductase [Litoribrevibacter albus]